MFQIENSIPLPARSATATKYPFASMNPGDSFAMPKDKASKSISAAARSWAQRTGRADWKFATRTNGETVRVWRTV